MFGEQFELNDLPGRRFLLEPRGHGLRAVLAEELLRALGDRQQAHDALLRLDDAAFPLGKLDAERLREAAHDVEDQREALGLAAGRTLVVIVLVGVARPRPRPRRPRRPPSRHPCSGASRGRAP